MIRAAIQDLTDQLRFSIGSRDNPGETAADRAEIPQKRSQPGRIPPRQGKSAVNAYDLIAKAIQRDQIIPGQRA